jgi:hypothetical protein
MVFKIDGMYTKKAHLSPVRFIIRFSIIFLSSFLSFNFPTRMNGN